jgi:hypothetical protein
MKKLIPLLLVVAVLLLVGGSFAPAYAQDSANEEKPTFYRLVPGTYVNGWPRFTVTYPKDWVERHLSFLSGEVFRVSPPRSGDLPTFRVSLLSSYIIPPLDKFANYQASLLSTVHKDVIVVNDKPSQLRDGTPAQEFQVRAILEAPVNWLTLSTKKGGMVISTSVGGLNVRIGEDLKAILYSLQYEPGKDEPVKVPPDIQEFLDKHCGDLVSHDVTKVMTHYSDKYLSSGERKGEAERRIRQFIGSVTSFEYSTTDFIPASDRVYLTGFVTGNLGRTPLKGTSIIKENGEWKWYGNQRDVSR